LVLGKEDSRQVDPSSAGNFLWEEKFLNRIIDAKLFPAKRFLKNSATVQPRVGHGFAFGSCVPIQLWLGHSFK